MKAWNLLAIRRKYDLAILYFFLCICVFLINLYIYISIYLSFYLLSIYLSITCRIRRRCP